MARKPKLKASSPEAKAKTRELLHEIHGLLAKIFARVLRSKETPSPAMLAVIRSYLVDNGVRLQGMSASSPTAALEAIGDLPFDDDNDPADAVVKFGPLAYPK